jgi:hypothetical protein
MMEKKEKADIPPETWEDRVRSLYKINGGNITPDIVIADAKNPESPLHSKFDWNLESAALTTWRETAREIIRSVRVVITVENVRYKPVSKKIPEFVRNPKSKPNHQGFTRLADMRTDKERALAAMLYEIERIEAAISRAIDIADGLGLVDECVGIRQALAVLKKRVLKAA